MVQVSDLSCYFPYDRILAVAGVTVKGSVPDITACPICKKPSLTVYRDPLSDKSRWLRCGSCRFSGDTIETYQRISRASSVYGAIREARRSGLCDGPPEKMTTFNIQAYEEAYPAFRAKVRDAWDQLTRNTVENPSIELIRHIQSKHLWHGWLRGPHKRLSRYLGGGDRKMVDDLFTPFLGKRILPRRGYRVVMAVPYQDVPGRICGMRFIGTEDEMSIPVLPFKVENPEGGLAMLDVLDGMEKTVYAVSRLDFALQFQKFNLLNNETPLKMVVYQDDTVKAWDAVNAERLIFWSDEIDWRLFRQAKRFKNGWISARPQLDRSKNDVSLYSNRQTPEMLMHLLDSTAVPWPRFIATWLADKQRDPQEVHATLNNVLFSPPELEALISECPERDRERLQRLLDESAPRQPERIFVSQREVANRSDGWFHVSKNGESLITDARVRLQCEVTDASTKEVYWYGEIHYRDRVLPFAGEPFRRIDDKPIEWLREKTAGAGLGYPQFEKSWARAFTNLVKRLNPDYRAAVVSEQLGLHESGEIAFPLFLLRDGEPVPTRERMRAPDTPALQVQAPVRRTVNSFDHVTPARAAWFAAAAAYVARLLGRIDHPVYVADASASSGISTFMETAGMPLLSVEQGTVEEKQALLHVTRKYGYPTHLRATGDALDKLPYESYSGCFVSVQRLAAAALCTREPGIIIRDAPLGDRENLPPFDDVVWYLAELQRNKFKLDQHNNTVIAALRGFCHFQLCYLSCFDEAHFAIAASRIRSCLNPGDSLLELAVLLCLSGKLGLEHYDLTFCLQGGYAPNPGRKAVCLDVEHGQVYLPRRALLRACDRFGVPRPDLFKAEKDLSARKLLLAGSIEEGLVTSSELWDEVVKACRREVN